MEGTFQQSASDDSRHPLGNLLDPSGSLPACVCTAVFGNTAGWQSCLDNLGASVHSGGVSTSSGPLPLYAQIATDLRSRIAAGLYPPGARIPSEHELATQFGVGRPTVRQATDMLVRDGVLARRRGSGTYVGAPAPEIDLLSAGGTLSSFARSGLALEAALLDAVRIRQVPRRADHNPFAGRRVFFVTRRSTLHQIPVLLEEMYFDPDVFRDLDRLPIEGRSLSELAREHYRLRPVAQDQSFRAYVPDPKRARLLSLGDGTAVLHVRRSVDLSGAPAAVFAELFCRTDQLLFTQRLDLESATPRPVPTPEPSSRERQ